MNKYINEIIRLYTGSEISEPAKRKFHEWLVNGEYTEEKRDALLYIWNNTDNLQTKDIFQSLLSLQAKYYSLRMKKRKKALAFLRNVAAIASIVILSSVYFFTNTNKTHVETNFVEHFSEAGKYKSITLPDGSIIYANSGTIILYPESYGEDTRTVYISGEANFDVRKNSDIPFIVKSKGFSVTALGTEFDVSSYPDDVYFRATLISGSVKVQSDNDPEEYILKTNEQFVYKRDTQHKEIEQVDIHEATAWQRGELIFRGSTIKEILNALERKYAVSFQFRSNVFNDDKYNFRFKKDASLSGIMDIIKEVADDFDYKQIKDSYYINSKKMK
ncbi:FecR family protein [Dysgonomonas sp. 511]|uniref:FecR family protein n=1 Tax=Dysgonomonas sp. 511 TaxID=2302930 RepID=UPI0013D20497|nr:FecR family protein [Dysgonomonas sp. 511]